MRRPQRPGTSPLDTNRNSSGDSPSREPPATLNLVSSASETYSRFDCIAICRMMGRCAIANCSDSVHKLWRRSSFCGRDEEKRENLVLGVGGAVLPRAWLRREHDHSPRDAGLR